MQNSLFSVSLSLPHRMQSVTPMIPCANHSLNLVVVGGAKSSTKALLFFGVLKQFGCTLLIFHATLDETKKNLPRSLKSQSATRWKSRYHCISPLCCHLADVLEALKELESYCSEKRMVKQLITSVL